jgi:flagellar basal body-associated protein FliL
MRKIIVGATGLVVLIAAAGVGLFTRMHKSRAIGGHDAVKSSESAPKASRPPKVAFVEVNEVTLRLADRDSEHYIKLSPVLAVREPRAEEIQARLPIVRDRVVTLVTARPSTELATTQGELKLKSDLLEALRPDFQDEIVDIYFNGYLVE